MTINTVRMAVIGLCAAGVLSAQAATQTKQQDRKRDGSGDGCGLRAAGLVVSAELLEKGNGGGGNGQCDRKRDGSGGGGGNGQCDRKRDGSGGGSGGGGGNGQCDRKRDGSCRTCPAS